MRVLRTRQIPVVQGGRRISGQHERRMLISARMIPNSIRGQSFSLNLEETHNHEPIHRIVAASCKVSKIVLIRLDEFEAKLSRKSSLFEYLFVGENRHIRGPDGHVSNGRLEIPDRDFAVSENRREHKARLRWMCPEPLDTPFCTRRREGDRGWMEERNAQHQTSN